MLEYSSSLSLAGVFACNDKDNDGCSIDFAGERNEEKIAFDFKKRFEKNQGYYGVAKILEDDVYKIKYLNVKHSPSKSNKNHGLIFDVNKGRISLTQAKLLARLSSAYDLQKIEWNIF